MALPKEATTLFPASVADAALLHHTPKESTSNNNSNSMSFLTNSVDAQEQLQNSIYQTFVRDCIVSAFKLAVKQVVACGAGVDVELDDSHPAVKYLLILLEIALTHGLKAKKAWFGDKRNLWAALESIGRLAEAPPQVIDSLHSVACLESAKHPISKSRAWFRKALMENTLPISLKLLASERIIDNWYDEFAVLRHEDMNLITGLLTGLSSIQFTFYLKDELFDLTVSDFDLFFNTTSQLKEEAKMQLGVRYPELEVENEKEYQDTLQNKLNRALTQISYLEEYQKTLQGTIQREQNKLKQTTFDLEQKQKHWEAERLQMQNIVIELQERMSHLDRNLSKAQATVVEYSQAETEWKTDKQQMESVILELQKILYSDGSNGGSSQQNRNINESSEEITSLVALSSPTVSDNPDGILVDNDEESQQSTSNNEPLEFEEIGRVSGTGSENSGELV